MLTALAMAAATAVAPVADAPITAPGPLGALVGSIKLVKRGAPIVLILPGSGPTDRDGNNRLGVAAAPYRLLAEALAARGIGSVRIDKRGLGGSVKAVADGNAVTIADYVADTTAWVAATQQASGARCVWLAGHSEGGLIALAAAQRPMALCGVILLSAPGRPLQDVLRAQLAANPANAPLLGPANAAIAALVGGRRVAAADLPAPLQALFAPAVQGYLIDVFGYDPAALAARVRVPLTIVQGGADLQVGVADAHALAAANPRARLVLLDGVNHVLKDVGNDRTANRASYADPARPIALGVVDAVAAAVRAR